MERLGGGGMGAVYRAMDTVLEREVALKILAADVDDPEKRFRAEAIAIARLSHPGLASVYELFEHDGRWIMVMELVRGETVEQIADRVGPLPPKRAAELCMQALTALAHAHRAGVVHRDLKPSNLMITGTGGLKIMDFGIALVAGAERLTNDGYMMGTPAYMAPEQVSGREVDGRADLYAMGVVFYRLVTGRLPFKGDTPYEMAQAHLKDEPIPVDLIKPDTPLWVKYILDLALAKSPDQRFQSADAFYDALKRALLETASGPSRRPATGELPRPAIRTDRMAMSTGRTDRTARPAAVRAGRGGRPRAGVAIWTGLVTMAAAVSAVAVIWLQSPASAGTATVSLPTPPAPPAPPASTPAIANPLRTADTRPSAPPVAPRKPSAVPVKVTAVAPTMVAAFSNIKLLVALGPKLEERDVTISFWNQQLSIVPPDGSAPILTLPYARIEKATYVRAAGPRWDPALAGPAEVLELTGGQRHWLAVQSKDAYFILRLDGGGWQRVIETFESVSGRRVERPE